MRDGLERGLFAAEALRSIVGRLSAQGMSRSHPAMALQLPMDEWVAKALPVRR